MSGKRSRDKGGRGERSIVHLARKHGLEAVRVPLSGASEGYPGDVKIAGYSCEVKVRASGFKQLYDWLGDNHILFVRRDRDRWLAVLDADGFLEMLWWALNGKLG